MPLVKTTIKRKAANTGGDQLKQKNKAVKTVENGGKKKDEEESGGILLTSSILNELVNLKLYQDILFEDFYIKITKEEQDGDEGDRILCLDLDKVDTLLPLAKIIIAGLKRRNGLVAKRKHEALGMRYYLSVDNYKDGAAINIRRYYYDYDDEEEKPTRDGICLRLGNFVKLIQEIEEMKSFLAKTREECALLIKTACIVLIIKRLVKEACRYCDGCANGENNQVGHFGGCLQDGEGLVNEHFSLEWLTEVKDGCETIYKSSVAKLGIPELIFGLIYDKDVINRKDEFKNELLSPLKTGENKREKELYDTVHEEGKLTLNERQIFEF